MKRIFTLFAIIGMFLVVSCGNSAEEKAQGEQDADNAANELLDEANQAVNEEPPADDNSVAEGDTTDNDGDSTNVETAAPEVDAKDAGNDDASDDAHDGAGH